jgi:nitrogen fixation protein FixH
MKKRMHPWALGTAAVVILFPVSMIVLALIASREDLNLESRGSYEQGRDYQRTIDVGQRTAALGEKPAVTYDAAARACLVRFPASLPVSAISGTVSFTFPGNDRSDFSRPLALDANGAQRIPLDAAAPGMWRVRVDWRMAGLDYRIEDRIYTK